MFAELSERQWSGALGNLTADPGEQHSRQLSGAVGDCWYGGLGCVYRSSGKGVGWPL